MLTLAVMLVVEFGLRALTLSTVAASLGGSASSLILLILALCAVPAASADVLAGFYSRLAYALAVLWYVGALYRWLPQIDALGGPPLLMGLAWLVLLPVLVLGLPALAPLWALRQRLPEV